MTESSLDPTVPEAILVFFCVIVSIEETSSTRVRPFFSTTCTSFQGESLLKIGLQTILVGAKFTTQSHGGA